MVRDSWSTIARARVKISRVKISTLTLTLCKQGVADKPTRTDAVHETVVVHVTFQAVEGTEPNATEVSEHVVDAVRKEGHVSALGARPTDCAGHTCVSYESWTSWVPAVGCTSTHAHAPGWSRPCQRSAAPISTVACLSRRRPSTHLPC